MPRQPAVSIPPLVRLVTMNKRNTLIALCLLIFWSGASNALSKNGFRLDHALIPPDEVFSGGPPRDGIPSIDKPRFIEADDADELRAGERILGLSLNGITKAYPLAIMNWHEIVNDRFGKDAVAVTYCPLCGTGMAFEARLKGRQLTFGVSGLLYNSDVLLYDRETESLWSQLDRLAVTGSFKGTRLQSIPLEHTTWRDWRRRHPDTLVLSRKTGYFRDYDRTPYAGYESSDDIYFPVRFRAEGYHPKERVLGLEIGGHFKAYPFSELAKQGGEVSDRIADTPVLVRFDEANQNARVETHEGEVLPGVVAFWFAWYAFHPETEIYRGEQR